MRAHPHSLLEWLLFCTENSPQKSMAVIIHDIISYYTISVLEVLGVLQGNNLVPQRLWLSERDIDWGHSWDLSGALCISVYHTALIMYLSGGYCVACNCWWRTRESSVAAVVSPTLNISQYLSSNNITGDHFMCDFSNSKFTVYEL